MGFYMACNIPGARLQGRNRILNLQRVSDRQYLLGEAAE